MLANVKHIGDYSDAYDFISIRNFEEVKNIFKISDEEINQYMKDNEENNNFWALFHILNNGGYSDEEIIREILNQEKGYYFLNYEEELNRGDGLFILYEIE